MPFHLALLAQTGLEQTVLPEAPWAPWVTLVIAITAIGLIVVFYLRERASVGVAPRLFLASLRAALVIIVLIMLYGRMLHRHTTDLPDLVIVLDDSASMNTIDQYDDEALRQIIADRLTAISSEDASRFNLARSVLAGGSDSLLTELEGKYNIKIYLLGGSARSLTGDALPERLAELTADENASRLGRGIHDIIEQQRGRPTAAVLVLTDGAITEGASLSDAAKYARRKKIPLFTLGIGNEKASRDVRISDLNANRNVFLGDVVNFDFRVSSNEYEGEQIRLELRRGDDQQPVASKQITLGADDQTIAERLSHRTDEEGTFTYTVTAVPLKNEATEENNHASKTVNVRDETIRVLMVQSYPNYEFRFLKNLLARQKNDAEAGGRRSIELKTLLQEADESYIAQDATAIEVFPVTREELFEYDVLIFGDVQPGSSLGAVDLENISAFVKERGGGVIFISGPRYTPFAYRQSPLEDLLPIALESAYLPAEDDPLDVGYQPQPTRLGMTTPPMQLGDNAGESIRIWSSLPPLYWMLSAPDLRAGVRVLAEHSTKTGPDGRKLPIIVMRYAGAGKVIFHATDETWRWRYQVGDYYFARYWIQAIRYLSRSKLAGLSNQVEIRSDREKYQYGETVRLSVRFLDDRLAPEADDGVVLVLKQDEGRLRQLTLNRSSASRGLFQTTLNNLPPGSYRLWLAAPTLTATAGNNDDPNNELSPQNFIIDPPVGESTRRKMEAKQLSAAAKISGGSFYTIKTAANIVDDLPPGRQVRIASLPPEPVWNYWPWVLAFVVLIVTEWLLRKRWGMV